MTLRSQFVFFDFEQAPLSVFFEYFSIMGTCIAITNYYIKFLVIKKGGRKMYKRFIFIIITILLNFSFIYGKKIVKY